MSEVSNLIGKVERVKVILIIRATTIEPVDDAEYALLRRELMSVGRVQAKLPRFLIQCRTVQELKSGKSQGYRENS